MTANLARVQCPDCTYRAASAGSLIAHRAMLHGAESRPSWLLPKRVNAPKRMAVTSADLPHVASLTASREAWMLAAVEELRPVFAEAGHPIPEHVRVSVGWPGGRGKKKGVVGQCWPGTSVADGIAAIFVSPVRVDPLDVLETLTHELVHAGGICDHKRGFAAAAAKVGLVGDPAWTGTAIHPAARERFARLAEKLGTYDHAGISASERQRIQGTRMLKVECRDCGCVIRMTRKWLDEAGVPKCGCGGPMEES